MLWAKLTVFAVVTFVLMLPAVLLGFFVSQAILSQHDILQISFSHSGVARAVIGGAVYLTLLGVFALAVGAMLAQHGRWNRRLCRRLLRHPTAAGHPADELEQQHFSVPAEQRGPLDLLSDAWRP